MGFFDHYTEKERISHINSVKSAYPEFWRYLVVNQGSGLIKEEDYGQLAAYLRDIAKSQALGKMTEFLAKARAFSYQSASYPAAAK
jgi:hypothetical protein